MHCEDNGKLRTPLNEVCITTDIGCVPIVNGQPQCSPMPDELPIAYDKITSTLWLFSCESRTWVAMSKFSMDQLQELNLDNINNICNLLNIGVYYNPGTGNIQGTVTLSEFTTKLLECLKLDTNVLAITQGENNTISISVEGLDGLPPFYIKGDNISFTGTGTQTDPLVVHGADPICKWPIASQAQVDAAAAKHLGACLDGQPSRVPYPPKPCEYPSLSKAQVDAAGEKRLIACVDGESVKVPWVETPCEYERVTEESVTAASSKDIIACVDGKNVKIPIPQGFFADSPCDYPRATQNQVTSASEKDVIVCLDGKDYKIPIPSAFFDPEFLCIPEVLEMPVDPPVQGTGPIRAGCNGEIYLWVCEQSKWVKFETADKHDYTEWTDENRTTLSGMYEGAGSSICDEVKFHAWYNTGIHKDCYEDVQISARNLVELLQKECELGCCTVVCTNPQANAGGGSGSSGGISKIIYGGWCFNVQPSGVISTYSSVSDGGLMTLKIKNPFAKPSLLDVTLDCAFIRHTDNNESPNVYARAFYIISNRKNENPFDYGQGALTRPNIGITELPNIPLAYRSDFVPGFTSPGWYRVTGSKGNLARWQEIIPAYGEVTLYGYYYILFYSIVGGGGKEHLSSLMRPSVRIFNNAVECDQEIENPYFPDDGFDPVDPIVPNP